MVIRRRRSPARGPLLSGLPASPLFNFYAAAAGVARRSSPSGSAGRDGRWRCAASHTPRARGIIQFSVRDVPQFAAHVLRAHPIPRRRACRGIWPSSCGAWADVAERDGVLASVGSTYSPENDVIFDGTTRPGVRLVSFAPILKHGLFPLAELLSSLLEVSEQGVGGPVELEFAANLADRHHPAEFALLQAPARLRPRIRRSGDR